MYVLCLCVLRRVCSVFVDAATVFHRLSLLFTSVSLIYAYFRVVVVGGHHAIVSCEKHSHIERGSYQRHLQQESSCASTFLGLQYSRPRSPIRGLPRRGSLFESGGSSQANTLLGRNCCLRAAAVLPCHRRALQLHKFSSWAANVDDFVFRKGCHRPRFSSSRIPLNTSQRESPLFIGGTSIRLIRIICLSGVTAPILCLRTAVSSASRLLSAPPRCTASSGSSSSFPSFCGCVVTYVVQKNADQRREGEETKQSIAQTFSASTFRTATTCNCEITADSRFESTAEHLPPLGRNKDAPSLSAGSGYKVAGHFVSSRILRSPEVFYSRPVKICPGTPECRLDVFLTKHIGISRTLVGVHLIKGRNVWINETLCVTPSRRLRPGDCITCLLPSTCKDEVTGLTQQIQNADATGDNSKEGRIFFRSQSLIDQHAREQLRCETLRDNHNGDWKTCSTRLTSSSRTFEETEPASETNVFLPCSAERAHVIEGGKNFARTDTQSFALTRIQNVPEAQTEASHTRTALGSVEHPRADLRLSDYCSRPRRNLDADEDNSHQEVPGVKQRKSFFLVPDERPIHILYEDDHILVLNKPANVLTHPPELHIGNLVRYNAAGSVVHRLLHYFNSSKRDVPETFAVQTPSPVAGANFLEHSELPRGPCAEPAIGSTPDWKDIRVKTVETHRETDSEGADFFERLIRVPLPVSRPGGIVHRLDFGTTGVLAVAKTFAAAAGLREQWKRREVFKGYVGVCFPELRARRKIDAPITRHQVDRARMQAIDLSDSEFSANIASKSDRGRRPRITSVREATTIITPVGGNSTWGLVAAIALTGRTHQVRVHLEYAGHPLVGDPLYGQLPRRRDKKRATEAIQRDHGSPNCAAHIGVKEIAKRSAAPRKKMPSYTRISRQTCSRPGRLGKAVDSEQAGGSAKAAECEHCISPGSTWLPSRPLLHAYLLRIRHPVTGRYQEFKAPVPSDITCIADQLNTNWRRQLERILDNEVAIT